MYIVYGNVSWVLCDLELSLSSDYLVESFTTTKLFKNRNFILTSFSVFPKQIYLTKQFDILGVQQIFFLSATHGRLWATVDRGSLTNPMLITAFDTYSTWSPGTS